MLDIYAKRKFSVGIKRYSGKVFSAGYYYYVGSAQRTLIKRIERHCKPDKKIHWHIDHITAQSTAKVKRVFIFKDMPKSFECELVLFWSAGFPNAIFFAGSSTA